MALAEEIAELLTSQKSAAAKIARRKQAVVVLVLPKGIQTSSGTKAESTC